MTVNTRFRHALFLIALLGSILAVSPAVSQQEGADWDLGSLEGGKSYPTSVTAVNASCRGKHDFAISVEGNAAQFIQITGPDTLRKIGRGQSKETAALVDLRQAPPGSYEGVVRVRCTTCPPNCSQDYRDLTVHFTVSGPGGSAPSIATTSGGDSTQVRNPCPDDISGCDELLRRAQALDSEASTAEALARRLESDQEWNDEQAEALEDFAEQTDEFTRQRRDQARQWRELAEHSEEDARVNEQRAQQYPEGHPWRDSWERDAESDRTRARERRERADEIDRDADRTDNRSEDDTDRAEELRRRSELAREDAVKKRQLAEDAWAAYDACLQATRERCENQRKEAERRAAAQLESSRRQRRDAAAAAEAQIAEAEAARLAAEARIGSNMFGYEHIPGRTSTVCETIVFEIPRGAPPTSNVRVVRNRLADDPSAIEIEQLQSESTLGGRSFTYHCVHEGSAVITFIRSDGGAQKRYKMRVLCAASD